MAVVMMLTTIFFVIAIAERMLAMIMIIWRKSTRTESSPITSPRSHLDDMQCHTADSVRTGTKEGEECLLGDIWYNGYQFPIFFAPPKAATTELPMIGSLYTKRVGEDLKIPVKGIPIRRLEIQYKGRRSLLVSTLRNFLTLAKALPNTTRVENMTILNLSVRARGGGPKPINNKNNHENSNNDKNSNNDDNSNNSNNSNNKPRNKIQPQKGEPSSTHKKFVRCTVPEVLHYQERALPDWLIWCHCLILCNPCCLCLYCCFKKNMQTVVLKTKRIAVHDLVADPFGERYFILDGRPAYLDLADQPFVRNQHFQPYYLGLEQQPFFYNEFGDAVSGMPPEPRYPAGHPMETRPWVFSVNQEKWVPGITTSVQHGNWFGGADVNKENVGLYVGKVLPGNRVVTMTAGMFDGLTASMSFGNQNRRVVGSIGMTKIGGLVERKLGRTRLTGDVVGQARFQMKYYVIPCGGVSLQFGDRRKLRIGFGTDNPMLIDFSYKGVKSGKKSFAPGTEIHGHGVYEDGQQPIHFTPQQLANYNSDQAATNQMHDTIKTLSESPELVERLVPLGTYAADRFKHDPTWMQNAELAIGHDAAAVTIFRESLAADFAPKVRTFDHQHDIVEREERMKYGGGDGDVITETEQHWLTTAFLGLLMLANPAAAPVLMPIVTGRVAGEAVSAMEETDLLGPTIRKLSDTVGKNGVANVMVNVVTGKDPVTTLTSVAEEFLAKEVNDHVAKTIPAFSNLAEETGDYPSDLSGANNETVASRIASTYIRDKFKDHPTYVIADALREQGKTFQSLSSHETWKINEQHLYQTAADEAFRILMSDMPPLESNQ